MRRRVEHGLIFGDIRMIHDPLAARQRAVIFSAVAVALIAAMTALFAWLRPNADPGDAPILRANSGELYVRVDDRIHPVTNLTSARLIAGAPEHAARIGEENLLELPRGVPVGITTAPAAFAPADSTDGSWSVCTPATAAQEVLVSAGQPAEKLPPHAAVVAVVDADEWLITGEGRHLLPRDDDPQGRIIRRALGIDATTPRWTPPAQVLTVVRELPPITLPDPSLEVLVIGAEAWVLTPSGGVSAISELQRDILIESGASRREMDSSEIAGLPDADPAPHIPLPATVPEWIDPTGVTVCATEERVGATLPDPPPTQIPLSGDAVATAFTGLDRGSVAVDTGHGFHVVSTTGMRHPVAQRETLQTIGAEHVETVPWELVALLPQGAELSQDAALKATY